MVTRERRDKTKGTDDSNGVILGGSKGGEEGTGHPMLEEISIMFYMTEQNDGVNLLAALFSSLGGQLLQ